MELTEEMKSEIRKIVAGIIEVPVNELSDSADFVKDLGVDSMVALEIVSACEKRLNKTIPEKVILTVRSLNDIFKITEPLLEDKNNVYSIKKQLYGE